MKAWTHLRGPGPALLVLIVFCSIQSGSAAPYETEQNTELEYYPVADATGCYYNFEHYDEGDRIITNEPCLNCTCHNRMLMCYLRVCPFTKAIGQDCKVEKKSDQCCPVIICPEVPVQLVTHSPEQSTTALGHLNEYGCSIDGLFYADGAKVPSNPNNPCEVCYCIRNKTACIIQDCTLRGEVVEGCKPVYVDGVCCPLRYDCDHPQIETTPRPLLTTTTTTTTTTTLPPTAAPSDCLYNNEIYPDGTLLKNDVPCEKCYCMKGDIICAVQECGPTPLDKVNCTALPIKEGQCCPDTYDCEQISEEDLTTISSYEVTTVPPSVTTGKEGSTAFSEEGDKTQHPEKSTSEGSEKEKTPVDKESEEQEKVTTESITESITEAVTSRVTELMNAVTTIFYGSTESPQQEQQTEPAGTVPIESSSEDATTPFLEQKPVIHHDEIHPSADEGSGVDETPEEPEETTTTVAINKEETPKEDVATTENNEQVPDKSTEELTTSTGSYQTKTEKPETEEPSEVTKENVEYGTQEQKTTQKVPQETVQSETEPSTEVAGTTARVEPEKAPITEESPTEKTSLASEKLPESTPTEELPDQNVPSETEEPVTEKLPEEEGQTEESPLTEKSPTEESVVTEPTQKPEKSPETKTPVMTEETPTEKSTEINVPVVTDESLTEKSEIKEPGVTETGTERSPEIKEPSASEEPSTEKSTEITEAGVTEGSVTGRSPVSKEPTETEETLTEMSPEIKEPQVTEESMTKSTEINEPSETEKPLTEKSPEIKTPSGMEESVTTKSSETTETSEKEEPLTEKSPEIKEPGVTEEPITEKTLEIEEQSVTTEHEVIPISHETSQASEGSPITEKSSEKTEVSSVTEISAVPDESYQTTASTGEITQTEKFESHVTHQTPVISHACGDTECLPEEPEVIPTEQFKYTSEVTTSTPIQSTEQVPEGAEIPTKIHPEHEELTTKVPVAQRTGSEVETTTEPEMEIITSAPTKDTAKPPSMDHVSENVPQTKERVTTPRVEPIETTVSSEISSEKGTTSQEVDSNEIPSITEKCKEKECTLQGQKPLETEPTESNAIPSLHTDELPISNDCDGDEEECVPTRVDFTDKPTENPVEIEATQSCEEGKDCVSDHETVKTNLPKLDTTTKTEVSESTTLSSSQPDAETVPIETDQPHRTEGTSIPEEVTGEEKTTQLSVPAPKPDLEEGSAETELPLEEGSGFDYLDKLTTQAESVATEKTVEKETADQAKEHVTEVTGKVEAELATEKPATEREEAVTEKEGTVTEKEKAVTEKEETVTEKEEADKEKEVALTEEKETVTDNGESTTEKEELITEKDENATEKMQVTSEEIPVTGKGELSTEKEKTITEIPQITENETSTGKEESVTEKEQQLPTDVSQPTEETLPDITQNTSEDKVLILEGSGHEISEGTSDGSGNQVMTTKTSISPHSSSHDLTTEPASPGTPQKETEVPSDTTKYSEITTDIGATTSPSADIEKVEESTDLPEHKQPTIEVITKSSAEGSSTEVSNEIEPELTTSAAPEQPKETTLKELVTNTERITTGRPEPPSSVGFIPEGTTVAILEEEIVTSAPTTHSVLSEETTTIREYGVPGEGNCLVDGQTYKNNSIVPPVNPCQESCKCISSILQCQSVPCEGPPGNMQNCVPLPPSSDSCCPTYSCSSPGATSMESDSHVRETTIATTHEESDEKITTSESTALPAETIAEATKATLLPSEDEEISSLATEAPHPVSEEKKTGVTNLVSEGTTATEHPAPSATTAVPSIPENEVINYNCDEEGCPVQTQLPAHIPTEPSDCGSGGCPSKEQTPKKPSEHDEDQQTEIPEPTSSDCGPSGCSPKETTKESESHPTVAPEQISSDCGSSGCPPKEATETKPEQPTETPNLIQSECGPSGCAPKQTTESDEDQRTATPEKIPSVCDTTDCLQKETTEKQPDAEKEEKPVRPEQTITETPEQTPSECGPNGCPDKKLPEEQSEVTEGQQTETLSECGENGCPSSEPSESDHGHQHPPEQTPSEPSKQTTTKQPELTADQQTEETPLVLTGNQEEAQATLPEQTPTVRYEEPTEGPIKEKEVEEEPHLTSIPEQTSEVSSEQTTEEPFNETKPTEIEGETVTIPSLTVEAGTTHKEKKPEPSEGSTPSGSVETTKQPPQYTTAPEHETITETETHETTAVSNEDDHKSSEQETIDQSEREKTETPKVQPTIATEEEHKPSDHKIDSSKPDIETTTITEEIVTGTNPPVGQDMVPSLDQVKTTTQEAVTSPSDTKEKYETVVTVSQEDATSSPTIQTMKGEAPQPSTEMEVPQPTEPSLMHSDTKKPEVSEIPEISEGTSEHETPKIGEEEETEKTKVTEAPGQTTVIEESSETELPQATKKPSEVAQSEMTLNPEVSVTEIGTESPKTNVPSAEISDVTSEPGVSPETVMPIETEFPSATEVPTKTDSPKPTGPIDVSTTSSGQETSGVTELPNITEPIERLPTRVPSEQGEQATTTETTDLKDTMKPTEKESSGSTELPKITEHEPARIPGESHEDVPHTVAGKDDEYESHTGSQSSVEPTTTESTEETTEIPKATSEPTESESSKHPEEASEHDKHTTTLSSEDKYMEVTNIPLEAEQPKSTEEPSRETDSTKISELPVDTTDTTPELEIPTEVPKDTIIPQKTESPIPHTAETESPVEPVEPTNATPESDKPNEAPKITLPPQETESPKESIEITTPELTTPSEIEEDKIIPQETESPVHSIHENVTTPNSEIISSSEFETEPSSVTKKYNESETTTALETEPPSVTKKYEESEITSSPFVETEPTSVTTKYKDIERPVVTQQPDESQITVKEPEPTEGPFPTHADNGTKLAITTLPPKEQPIEMTTIAIPDEKEKATEEPLATSLPEATHVPQNESELYTSGPQSSKITEKPPVPGELSTSMPFTTQPPSLHSSHIPDSPPEIPDVEEYPEYPEHDDNPLGPGTCRYGGKVYVSAQQIPRDDPCDFCFCFRSDIICLQQSCPPPIPNCHEEPIKGFCCPRYQCPVNMATSLNLTTSTTTTTTTLPPHFFSHAYKGRATRNGCQVSGRAYQVGDLIKSASGPCMHCICGGNGQMKCDPKPCSPEPMLRQMIAAVSSRRR